MYTGVVDLVLDDESLAQLYSGTYQNNDLYLNQYLIIKNSKEEVVDKGKWIDGKFTRLKYKSICNDLFLKVTPKNIEQEFVFDALQNEKITGVLISGGFGVGKTMLSLCYCLDQVTGNKGKYDRIIYLRNNIETKDTGHDLGALPGDLTSKIKPYAMPMADIIGSVTELENLILQEKIALDHIGFLRGRSFKNSLIILSEAQNTTREQIALIVARIGSGSRLIVEGDMRQWDKTVFNKNSGIFHMAEALKGDAEFAMITLNKNERSRFASLSDKILGIE
jgi:PhoH-like ATPase